jgi:hypothetical protein
VYVFIDDSCYVFISPRTSTELGGRYRSIHVLCAGDLEFYFALRTLIVLVIFVVLVESGERIKTISFRTYDDGKATAQN